MGMLLPNFVLSQNKGNEWINMNQSYYKFSIPKTGIYKVTNTELQNAGIDIGSFSPQNIQLFQKGIEIPCYIKGESQGLLEYILFYAEKNTGWFDVEMYDDPKHQTNPNYSLINDTAAVFLTWNTSFTNNRFNYSTDVNFTGKTPASYCWTESYVEFVNTFYQATEDCEFVEAEGWFDNSQLSLGGTITKTLPTPDFISAGVQCKINLAFASLSTNVYLINNTHHVEVTGPDLLIDTIYTGYKSIISNASININSLDSETKIQFRSIDDQGASSSLNTISYIKLKYSRGFAADKSLDFWFNLPASPTQKSYIEVSGFVSDGEPYLFDLSQNTISKVVEEGNLHKALVTSSSEESKLVLIDENYFFSPAKIAKAPMINHSAKNKAYIIITHNSLWESATSYANYRNAYLVDVNTLFNQFGYGIQKHPLAIRNFLSYVYTTWDVKPEYLLLIGKGIQSEYFRNNNAYYAQNLVPTMGMPAGDNLISNRINSSGYEPNLFTGRIAANTNAQVNNYLDKVKEFESNAASEWMKRGIHFGGGIDAAEQSRFRNYLKNYENTIEDTLFGGFISTFLKTSSDPIVTSKSDSIKSLVNKGVSLMTFFGHGSSEGGFDQDIDEPSTYENRGKYPLMISNSCYTGNIHLPNNASKSEAWMLIPDKGAIAFLAVTKSGYVSQLNTFSEYFYKGLSKDYYGQTLGKIMHNAFLKMQNFSTSQLSKLTIHAFTLHGDPAIVLNSFELPDLTINKLDISFDPPQLTTALDSFYIQIIATNQAKTTNKEFTIDIDRTFQTGEMANYSVELNGLKFKDTLRIKLPIDQTNGLGNNIFDIYIDRSNTVQELNETNNSIQVNTFISSTNVVPVFPYKYSLNPSNNFILKASSADVFSDIQTTVFQIDTSYLFNSSMLVSENIKHGGGVVEWQPSITFEENKTYFWRSAKNDDEKKWSQSSFSILKDNTGWQQSNFGQHIENKLFFLEKNEISYEFEFTDAPKTLRIQNVGSPATATERNSIAYSIDGLGDGGSCQLTGAMVVAVLDSLTFIPWESDRANYGQANYPNCGTVGSIRPFRYFVFHSSNIDNITSLVNFIEQDVPIGNYFLMYSYINGNYSNYSEYQISLFESWGAQEIRFMPTNATPYIMLGRKGYPDETIEVVGADERAVINLDEELKGYFTYGSMLSEIIGPSKKWESLNWDFTSKEPENTEEQTFIKVYGIDNNDNTILLADSVKEKQLSLQHIDALQYPYMQLSFFTEDKINRTPAQLKNWEVLYTPVSDLAINPQKGFEFYNDTLIEGDNGKFSIAFENIGYADVDSTKVNYWLQSNKNEQFPLATHTIAPLKKGEHLIDSIEFKTLSKSGNFSFWVELNPTLTNQRASNYREQYYFNNQAQKPFYIVPDKANPLLDVTFDGVHIMDGDLVSAKPEIIIQLKDENQYIALNDTSLFSIYIKPQQTGIEKRVTLGNNPAITFIPAKLPTNKAQIIYNASFSNDGIYELRVQAKDETGNQSGEYDYIISFQVINESSITHVFNYPNPFSTSTRFVFELTGSEIPNDMRIEIMTVSGKVVKVIYLEDIGPINIGKNITQYQWDGKDMYGDPLAIGVYFYRVNARLNGEELKIRDVGTSQYFKNGFGKMYLIR